MHSIEVVFFARFIDPIENIRLNQEDHSEYGWFAEDEIDAVATPEKLTDDDEFVAMKKGFALLRGDRPQF